MTWNSPDRKAACLFCLVPLQQVKVGVLFDGGGSGVFTHADKQRVKYSIVVSCKIIPSLHMHVQSCQLPVSYPDISLIPPPHAHTHHLHTHRSISREDRVHLTHKFLLPPLKIRPENVPVFTFPRSGFHQRRPADVSCIRARNGRRWRARALPKPQRFSGRSDRRSRDAVAPV